MNDLVWNLKDSEGHLVGNGVYIWNINFRFKSGILRQRSFMMGVHQSSPADYNQCISELKLKFQ